MILFIANKFYKTYKAGTFRTMRKSNFLQRYNFIVML